MPSNTLNSYVATQNDHASASQTRALLLAHYEAYPCLQPEDIFKFIYQSAFGCEHMISSLEGAIRYIKEEASRCPPSVNHAMVEPLDGEYSRVHLGLLDEGLRAETLGRLFYLSAVHEEEGNRRLAEKLKVAGELVQSGQIPLDAKEFQDRLAGWKNAGYGAIHHSDAFREAYHPAYRVIAKAFTDLLPLLAVLDRQLPSPKTVNITLCQCSEAQFHHISHLLKMVYGEDVATFREGNSASACRFDVSSLR